MDFEISQTYHIFKGPGKPYKIHILAIIEENYIVFRWYGRHKQWWHYEIEHKNILKCEIDRAQKYGT